MMQGDAQLHLKLLDNAFASHPEAVAKNTMRLWHQLAPELISIIGEEGFKPLYERSVRLASAQYPWIAEASAEPSATARFAILQQRLQGQDAPQAALAGKALLTIFLNILASLIGEELTTHLLYLAWNNEPSHHGAKDLP